MAVTVLSAPGMAEIEGRTFFCTTADVSAGGVRLVTDVRVPGSSVLELRVAFRDPLQSFRHRGRVVWVSEVEQGRRYGLGIELLDRGSGAMIQWGNLIRSKLGAMPQEQD